MDLEMPSERVERAFDPRFIVERRIDRAAEALEKLHSLVGEAPVLLSSAAAEALVTPHTDPADSATDVVFRAEQALAQSRTVASEPQSSLDPSLSQR